MNYEYTGASQRHATPPHFNPGVKERKPGRKACTGTLSTSELRRLVAAMVD